MEAAVRGEGGSGKGGGTPVHRKAAGRGEVEPSFIKGAGGDAREPRPAGRGHLILPSSIPLRLLFWSQAEDVPGGRGEEAAPPRVPVHREEANPLRIGQQSGAVAPDHQVPHASHRKISAHRKQVQP